MNAPTEPGARIAERYTVQTVLASWPHEILCRAVTDWNETVLLAVYDPPHANTPAGERVRQSTVRGARLLAQVQHPHLPRVTDLVDTPDRQVVATEDRLTRTLRGAPRPGTPTQATELTRTLFRALSAAHAQALLHTRISPDAVWVDASGFTRLGQFGLAGRALQDAKVAVAPDPRYAAPEVLSGGPFSPQSDVYALAATLHELFSGAPCPPATARAQGVPLPALPDGTPEALRAALRDALALDPGRRAVSASEVLEVLDRPATTVPAVSPAPEVRPVPPPSTAAAPPVTGLPAQPARPVSPARTGHHGRRVGAAVTAALIGAALLGAALHVGGQSDTATLGISADTAAQTTSDAVTASPAAESSVAAPAAEQITLVVNTVTLNVRAGPGADSAVVGTLARGDLMLSSGAGGDWQQVSTSGGLNGWVKTDLTLPLRTPEETQALMAQFEAGGEVTVGRGAYLMDRTLTVAQPLTVKGAGMKDTVLISAAAQDTVVLEQTDVTLTDLTVAHVGRLPARSVHQTGGQLTLERVLLTGAVRDDQLSEYGSGLWVTDGGQADVTDASFTANAFGIYASDDSVVNVDASTFTGNRDGGLLFRDASGGTVQANVIELTGAHGIHVNGDATPDIQDNQIRRNKGRGVTIYGRAAPELTSNTIEDNGLQGIGVQDDSAPSLTGNTIRNNRQSGVTFFDQASGTARNNTVQGNRTAGFRMMNFAQPTLVGNTVTRNLENGLAYSEDAAGTASDNIISGSGNPGIAAWGDAHPTLKSNTVQNGRQSGVVMAERSGGVVSGNQISGNALYGLIVTGSAQPQVSENTVTNNASGGIFYKQNAGGSGFGNTCFGNGGQDLQAALAPDNPGPDFLSWDCGGS
ncbi:kinase (plasmid) [Deinococcus actinosclerus]|nr:kinase [Deinococcus actinosclerus]